MHKPRQIKMFHQPDLTRFLGCKQIGINALPDAKLY